MQPPMKITITIDPSAAQRALVAALARDPSAEAFSVYLASISALFHRAIEAQAPGEILSAASLTCRPLADLIQAQGGLPLGDWVAGLPDEIFAVVASVSART